MKKFVKVGALSAMLGVSGMANAVITNNPGFETGDTTGWTEILTPVTGLDTGGSATVVGSHSSSWFASSADGSNFLLIGTPNSSEGNPPVAAQTVSRTETLAVGDKLDFWFAFDVNSSAYDVADRADLVVTDSGNNTVVSLSRTGANASTAGVFDTSSFSVTTAGAYTITFSAQNSPDEFGTSFGLFDMAFTAATSGNPGGGTGGGGTGGQVPEPATLALLGLGLAGLGAARRRKQA